MMGVIAAVAGAIQIASWVIALLDAIDTPKSCAACVMVTANGSIGGITPPPLEFQTSH